MSRKTIYWIRVRKKPEIHEPKAEVVRLAQEKQELLDLMEEKRNLLPAFRKMSAPQSVPF